MAALFALSGHVAQMPTLITTMAAMVVRELGARTLAHVLSAPGLERATLDGFGIVVEPPLAALAPRAMRMEEAYGLSALGLLARGGYVVPEGPAWPPLSRLGSALYKALSLDDDVAGYRRTAHELQELASAPLEELRATPELDASEVRRHGLLATLLVSNLPPGLLALHRADARVELARLALVAARYRLEHGAYPTSLDELGVAAPGVVLEGDGSYVRLARPDFEDDDRPLDLRLPPLVE